MKLIARLIFSFFANLLALLAADYFIAGFEVSPGLENLLIIVAVFTLLSVFIRPIIKIVLTPVIFLTFGVGIIFVNALVLYLLDYFVDAISITGLYPLFYATLIISVVGFFENISARGLYSRNKTGN